MKTNQYTCNKCDYSVDHPVDNCPVCGAVFYWMIRHAEGLSPEQRSQYVEIITSMKKGQINRDYLLHGGRIWLPHAFWQSFPSGEPLNQFEWIQDLQLVQYKQNAGEAKSIERSILDDYPEFDTQPNLKVVGPAIKDPRKSSPGPSPSEGRFSAILLRKFPGPISVGIFLVLCAFAYFSMIMGSQHHMQEIETSVELKP